MLLCFSWGLTAKTFTHCNILVILLTFIEDNVLGDMIWKIRIKKYTKWNTSSMKFMTCLREHSDDNTVPVCFMLT